MNGYPVDRQLLELNGQNVRLEIEDYTDSIGEFIDTDTTEENNYDTSQK